MYYYKIGVNEINKYEVNYDLNSLKNLKKEVKKECNLVIPCHYQGTEFRDKKGKLDDNKECVRFNYVKEKIVDVISYNDFYTPSEDVYDFAYEKIIYSDLVSIIDKLLKSDISVLDGNFNYLNDTMKIRAIKEYQNKNINHNKEGLQKIIEDCSKLDLEGEYKKLHNLVCLKLIDTLTKEEYERVVNFFDSNIDNVKKLTLVR